jgi:mannose-6-phosphate isomerase class I
MANSDNVYAPVLTPKEKDIDTHSGDMLDYESGHPRGGAGSLERGAHCLCVPLSEPEFGIDMLRGRCGCASTPSAPKILLCVEGAVN